MLEIAAVIAISCLAFALFQSSQKRKQDAFLRSKAWYLYLKASTTHIQYQKAFDLYRRRNAAQLDPEILENMARADAFGSDLIGETIHLIQLSETRFDFNAVKQWSEEGKLPSSHKRMFETLALNIDHQPVWRSRKTAPAAQRDASEPLHETEKHDENIQA